MSQKLISGNVDVRLDNKTQTVTIVSNVGSGEICLSYDEMRDVLLAFENDDARALVMRGLRDR